MKKFLISFLFFVTFMCAFAEDYKTDRITTKEVRLVPSVTVARVQAANVSAAVAGSRSLYYWIVSIDASGNKSTPAGAFIVRNSASSLSTKYKNVISWTPVSGAISYDVLRTNSAAAPTGACNCAVAVDVKKTTVEDVTEVLSSYSVAISASDFVLTNENGKQVIKFNGSTVYSVDGVNGFGFPNAVSFQKFNGLFNATQYANPQAAIDDAVASTYGGGAVVFPTGQYVSDRIVMKRAVSLVGLSSSVASIAGGVEFKQSNGANKDFVISDPSIPTTDDTHWTLFENVSVRGGTGSTVGSGIVFNTRTGEMQQLNRIFAEDFAEDGIRLNHGSQPLYWTNLHVFHNGGCGLNMIKTGADPWTLASVHHISGDDNGTALVCVNLGSGSGQASSVVDTLRFADVKSETHTAGKQQNAFVFNDMNSTEVVIDHASINASIAANAMIKLTGTSTPIITLIGIGIDCTHFAYLIDDQVHGIQVPCQPVANGRYKFPDEGDLDGVKLYHSGAGSQEIAGLIGRRWNDPKNVNRWKLGDWLTFCDGLGKDDSHCDVRIRRSGANDLTVDDSGGIRSTFRAGVLYSFTNKLTDASGNFGIEGITAAYTASAINAGACQSQTIATTGAAVGRVVVVNPANGTGAGDGFYYKALVSSTNNVTVQLCSTKDGLIPAAIQLRFKVLP